MAVRIAIGKKPIKPPRLARVHPRVVIISSVVLLAIVSARAAARALHQRYKIHTHWAHSSHPEPNWRKRNGDFTKYAKYVRKSIASGHGGGMADVEYCSAYACVCQKKCH